MLDHPRHERRARVPPIGEPLMERARVTHGEAALALVRIGGARKRLVNPPVTPDPAARGDHQAAAFDGAAAVSASTLAARSEMP
jgi:hypothetical protein